MKLFGFQCFALVELFLECGEEWAWRRKLARNKQQPPEMRNAPQKLPLSKEPLTTAEGLRN